MMFIIQNDPEVPPGTFATWLDELRVVNRVVKVFAEDAFPSLDAASSLIVLGGSMGVNDADKFPFLNKVKSLISHAVKLDIPCLGICLGGQLLADVLGATVYSGRNGEKGMRSVAVTETEHPDPLFIGIPSVFPVFQWHDDCFDIPEGAVHLASSIACPSQAFRHGSGLYGIQFHPELDREIVSSWIDAPRGGSSVYRILLDYLTSEQEYRAVSKTLLENFVRLAKRNARPVRDQN